MSTAPIQPDHPRLGIPSDKFGALSIPVQQPGGRVAVILMLYPPEQLRDQPLQVVEYAVHQSANALRKEIAREIHKSYTSEPEPIAATQNVVTALEGHIQAMRERSREAL